MTVYKNIEVEERSPAMSNQGSDFFAKTFEAPVVLQIPNTPLHDITEGFIVHFLSRTTVLLPNDHRRFESNGVSLALQALHASFAEHVPFCLSPQIAWYMIASEVATHIRLNQDRYRGYFTASAEKETIQIRDNSLVYGDPGNHWGRSINKVRDPLQEKIPQATIDLMLPTFSNDTFESDTALLVLFLDMVANYYGLEWQTLCGIPSVKVEGEAVDWQTIISHAEMAQSEFAGLNPYFTDLLPVLKEIEQAVADGSLDPEFWDSIYKYGGGSGGPYINGWITAFMAHKMYPSGPALRDDLNWRDNARGPFSGMTSSEMPVHLSKVPFVWDYFDTKISMAFVAGVMGVEHDGFLTPKLGYGVLEDVRGQLVS